MGHAQLHRPDAFLSLCLAITPDAVWNGAVGRTSSEIQTYLFPKELAQWRRSGCCFLLRHLFGGFGGRCLQWGCRLGGLYILLSCLRLLRGRDVFVRFYRGNRLLFSALERNMNTQAIGNVQDKVLAAHSGVTRYER